MTKAEPDISAGAQRLDFETAQPYEMWERARAECPVIRHDAATAFVRAGRPTFHVTRYDDVEQVLRDWETFSSVDQRRRSSASTWASSSWR